VDNLTALLQQVSQLLNLQAQVPGQITHAFDSLQIAVANQQAGIKAKLEVDIADFKREIDVQLRDAAGKIIANVEVKSGKGGIGAQLDVEQLRKDAMIAHDAQNEIVNIWRLTRQKFETDTIAEAQRDIETVMREVRDDVRKKIAADTGLTGAALSEEVKKTMQTFHFVDEVGKVIKIEFEGNKLTAVLDPAMEVLLGAEGKFAQSVLKHASSSPNFEPAMEALLGPTGKMAGAATHAAQGANFNAAEQDLEKKVEGTVTKALDDAGKGAADKAGAKLGQQITTGLNALGNVLTSIPALYNNVKQLGEAWDKPNKSTEDYMNLMASLGGVVMGVGQVIQAFSAIQEIATAVQAAFNAVAAMNPYVLLAIAVIALIAGIVLLIVYWDKVKAAIRDNPWIAVIAVMFGVIGVIILIIAYWDEVKLAVLIAANFVSIQMQRVGGFFIGVKNLAGMVWDWIVATVENAGIAIINAFITAGVGVENFFIGLVNFILDKYNAIATSVIGDVLGLKTAELIPEVDVKTKLIPPKEVPKVDVEAAFKPMTEDKTGGLEGQIAKQQAVVDKAHKEDEERRAKAAKEKADKEKAAAAAAPGAPGVPGAPAIPGLPPGAPGAPPALPGAPGSPPALPAAAPAGGGGVTIQGGITVNINADKLEADASKILSDEIVQALNTKLQALQGDANRRLGAAAA
jgi:hypothetical protein